jgi:hypothetical protein
MLPTINIHYSSYLDEIFKAWIYFDSRYKDWVCPSVDEVKKIAEFFAHVWEERGKGILGGLCKKTGLKFQRNYFSVYVVSGNTRAYSDPIVIKSRFSEEEFLETLTHELIHCLFVDNADSDFVKNADKFPNHVVVFALIELFLKGTIYREIDTQNFPENKKYADAKEYVKKEGSANIIMRCRL